MLTIGEYHRYKSNMSEADYNKRLGDSFLRSASPRYKVAKTYYTKAEELFNKAATIASIYAEKELKEKATKEMHDCREKLAICNEQLAAPVQ